ncbi:hypothetical protein N7478_012007 [Penicillium angulare]|uniref:uncharacterized protein n=1 Tax=Penicillium angulare TaxID=116970 RepID=UPI002541CB25|nr:uncharacterized protein N7478_012007 [Penicillium angulare]KAJ5261412.1 hypothetical protein N7478_012007 [Penicillium angulare]
MPWTPVAAYHYERPFDALETLHRTVAGNLEHAWTRLRHQCPKIATVPDITGTRQVYTVPSEQQTKDWILATFHVHSEVTTNAEIFDSILLSSSDFMLHYIPHSNELLFRSPHWRIDGIGLILLQSCFLTFLNNKSSSVPDIDGYEIGHLPPCLEGELGFSLNITEEMRNAAHAELSVLAHGLPPASIMQSIMNVTTHGTSRRVSLRFASSTSEKIFAASKSRGLKITTAVQAALSYSTTVHSSTDRGSDVF